MAGTVGPGCAERLAGGDSGAGGDVDDGTTTLPISPKLARNGVHGRDSLYYNEGGGGGDVI